ncbi:MAG: LLM class flavin-dependent oxidoreductase [Ktedonobacterales bacterium]
MSVDQPARRMKLGVMPSMGEDEERGGRAFSYAEIRDMAQAAEDVGLDSFWLADHLLYRFPGKPEAGAWEVFPFLGALAEATKRITLGPLVACTSFRSPALLAKMAESMDEITGGRFILGLGAGWHEPEYTAFGYPFDHRAARFEEALKIIVPLLREGHVDFHGAYYEATDTVLRPRGPSQGRFPIWIGAHRPRMLRLVARYADTWNTVWHERSDAIEAQKVQIAAACQAVGRDPATLELTAGTFAHILASGEQPKPDESHIAGSPEEVALALKGFADAGVKHLVVLVEPESAEGIARFGEVVTLLDHIEQ